MPIFKQFKHFRKITIALVPCDKVRRLVGIGLRKEYVMKWIEDDMYIPIEAINQMKSIALIRAVWTAPFESKTIVNGINPKIRDKT